MSQKQIYDHKGNVVRVLHSNPEDGFFGDFTIETIEDCEPVVDSAAVLADDHGNHSNLKHVARVPLSVAEQAMREGWFHDEKAWAVWLNNSDNRDFRVWKGRV
jgi:hypothetical protein